MRTGSHHFRALDSGFPALVLSFLVLFCHAAPAQLGGGGTPSFGSVLTGHKKVVFQRRLPPVTNVNGKTVSVVVARSGNGATSTELQSAIENLLTKSDSAVRVEGASPDYVITCSISAYSPPQVKTTTENKVTTQTMSGAMSVAFRIGEPRSAHIIASGVASYQLQQPVDNTTNAHAGALGSSVVHLNNPFHRPTGADPGTPKVNSTIDAENLLVNETARQVAAYLVNTKESVEAVLAVGGALNAANNLATSNLWTRNLEQLETMTPYPDPRVDAYRLYNIGVANEALAYQAQDSKAAIKYLQEASIDYGKAIDARPDEKGFLMPQERIKTALAHYTDSTSAPVAVAQEKPASDSMTNDDVIEMVHAHMDEANILDNIQSAPKVNFDLSTKGQVQLTNSGVKGSILAAMKTKARGSAAGPAHPPATPARSGSKSR